MAYLKPLNCVAFMGTSTQLDRNCNWLGLALNTFLNKGKASFDLFKETARTPRLCLVSECLGCACKIEQYRPSTPWILSKLGTSIACWSTCPIVTPHSNQSLVWRTFSTYSGQVWWDLTNFVLRSSRVYGLSQNNNSDSNQNFNLQHTDYKVNYGLIFLDL